MKKIGILVFMGLWLSACAPTTYRLGAQTYPSAGDALTAQRTAMNHILSKVEPRATPYAGRGVVFVPSDGDIRARGIINTGTPVPEVEDYVAAVGYRALAFFREVIAKRNLFESVELRDIAGSAKPEIGMGEHAVWAELIGPNQSGWKYFTSDMVQPDGILIDNSLPLGGARYVDWLDRLAQAVERNGGRAGTGVPSRSSDRAAPDTRAPTGGTAGTGKIKRTLD